jgi:hypothetical protein
MMPTPINPKMLELMSHPETKACGLHLQIIMKDGSKRTGTYVDLVLDPLNRVDYKDTQFIVFKTNQPEAGLKVYLPLTQIATIAWSY